MGLGEWGIHLVAGLPTGAEGPCSLHRSPECPYFSPCLSFLSSGLGSQSGASVQVLWRLALRWPAPRQRRMPWRMGKKPHKGAGCTQLEGRRSQQVHTQAACLVPSFPSVMPGATPLSLRGSAGRAVTPDVCPLLPTLQICFLRSARPNVLLRRLFAFQKSAEVCLPLTSHSNPLSL